MSPFHVRAASPVNRLPPPPRSADHRPIGNWVDSHRLQKASVEESVAEALGRIGRLDRETRSVTKVFEDMAMVRARELDRRIATSSPEALARFSLLGVPFLLKENIALEGAATQCASRILEGYRSPFHATVTEKLLEAGAVPVGYTNMDEFAMGSSCEHSCHGPTRNPYDLERVPGGSSGGGAVACALGLAPISLGSDTGGSVRQPAAYCHVYGFKPTYGLVSRYGLVAFGSSLDQISPFARSAEDLIAIMKVMAGPDSRDATSARRELGVVTEFPDPSAQLGSLRVGVPRKLLASILNDEVKVVFDRFLAGLGSHGAVLHDVELPELELALPAYYMISAAEVSSNLSRFDGLKYGRRVQADSREAMVRESRTQGFGAEAKRRICLGTFVLSAGYYDSYYGKACEVRKLIAGAFETVLKGLDMIVMPTTPSPAFKLGENLADPVQMYSNDVLTVPPSLVGLPALSVPMAGESGLPIGVQAIARHFEDARLLSLAKSLELLGLCGTKGIASGKEAQE